MTYIVSSGALNCTHSLIGEPFETIVFDNYQWDKSFLIQGYPSATTAATFSFIQVHTLTKLHQMFSSNKYLAKILHKSPKLLSIRYYEYERNGKKWKIFEPLIL